MTKPTATPSRKTKPSYRYVGTHVDDLHDGRTLQPGGFYSLSPDEAAHPHNARLIDEGLLVDTAPEGDE